jgi:hypothetical protein
MKRMRFVWLLLSLLLAACDPGPGSGPADVPHTLRVTDGTTERAYTVADLEALPATEATFNEIAYRGVSLSRLLQDAGFDPQGLKAVKAVAADGYSVNYDPALFQRQDVLVAYATSDGPLAEDDGVFRMVLPGEEGKLNLRMLVELRVSP